MRSAPTLRAYSCLVALPLIATACSTVSHTEVRPTPQDLPQFRVQSYDPANQCISRFIRQALDGRNERLLFLVTGLGDLTKNERDWTSGPLSAAGGYMLKDQLSRYGGSRTVLQGESSAEVRSLALTGQEFAVSDILRLQRRYDVNRIILLSGGFVGYDQARSGDGAGTSGGLRRDDAEVQAEIAHATESGRIDFILQITDAVTNRLLGTISMSGTERRRTATAKFTLEVHGVGVGRASQNVEVDGTHNVQSSIIAAAHFYLWQMILPGGEAARCLQDPATSPARFAARASIYEAATSAGRTRLLQEALNRVLGPAVPALRIDGIMGPATVSAIREAERKLSITPASRGDLGTLYARLSYGGSGR